VIGRIECEVERGNADHVMVGFSEAVGSRVLCGRDWGGERDGLKRGVGCWIN
jgi:hypothetical protein